jgi:hypothetical protein
MCRKIVAQDRMARAGVRHVSSTSFRSTDRMQHVVLETLLARQKAREHEVRSMLRAEGWYDDSPGVDELISVLM